MNPEPPGKSQAFAGSLARTKLLVALVFAVGGGAVAMVAGVRLDAPLVGWDVLALVFGLWVWLTVWRLSPAETASHARREDPTRDIADVVLLGAAIASLVAVGFLLVGAGGMSSPEKYVQAGFAVV